MTAAHGYHTYYDIIQAYDLADKRFIPNKEPTYKPNSVMGFLSSHEDFKLFTFLLKTARVDMIADQDQFFSTLFVCNDETIKKQLGEDFFMKLDRNTATKLVNVHSLPNVVNRKTLLGRRVAILDTKDDKSQITLTNNLGVLSLATCSQKYNIISDEIYKNNGLIYVLDGFFVPENFCF